MNVEISSSVDFTAGDWLKKKFIWYDLAQPGHNSFYLEVGILNRAITVITEIHVLCIETRYFAQNFTSDTIGKSSSLALKQMTF